MNNLRNEISAMMDTLANIHDQDEVERILKQTYSKMEDRVIKPAEKFYNDINQELYRNILRHYKYGDDKVCLWRFYKKISTDQINCKFEQNTPQELLDFYIRTYYYSDPLDDLTCIFIPINDADLIEKYLNWIKYYFYDVNYPTSLLWLYALDSTMLPLFPDEIVFLGRRIDSEHEDIMIPDFTEKGSVLFKRFSEDESDYVKLYGSDANKEFSKLFNFLEIDYRDRCLSRTGESTEDGKDDGWEKFEDVLRFGVSDRSERGCVSFSDLRSSTDFLNKFGKNIFRNIIQQPFFEQTKLISKRFMGKIDKFMGDNVMCVFLNQNDPGTSSNEREFSSISNNFAAIFSLCKVLYTLLQNNKMENTKLGLRSGVAHGRQILRSNLGNEIVRDFTVTGETVNLAARLEHISIQELILNNERYFENTINRFPQISELLNVMKDFENLNPETEFILDNYTLYQNIMSNLQLLAKARFDIRINDSYYNFLKDFFIKKGYKSPEINEKKRNIHGYEEFIIEGYSLKFYFSFYQPKGFQNYEKIWILPLDIDVLFNLDIEQVFK